MFPFFDPDSTQFEDTDDIIFAPEGEDTIVLLKPGNRPVNVKVHYSLLWIYLHVYMLAFVHVCTSVCNVPSSICMWARQFITIDCVECVRTFTELYVSHRDA